MHDRTRRSLRIRRRRLAWAGAPLLVLASCASPIWPSELDRGERVARSRLRELSPADFAPYARPGASGGASGGEDARDRFAGLDVVDLSIEQCRAGALENNLDLRVALIDPAIARERVSQEDARFEAAFTLRALWSDLDQPTASQLVSGQSNAQRIEPGVRIPTRTGGTATITLPWQRSEDDNSFSTLNPSYASDLEFSISHPLLRGAGRRAATSALRVASYEGQAAQARTALEVIRQLSAVDRAYWRLDQARRELEVRQRQLELADEQLGRARRRVERGALAEIEVVRAEAGVADRLEAIVVAQNAVLSRQRELKRVVNLPGLGVGGRAMVRPSSPPDPVRYEFDRDRLVASARANRMEMLELELRLAADAARIALERNQALPLLSVDATYRVNGLGDTTGNAFDQLADNDFADWQVGVNAEVPLGNEGAASRIREAFLTRMQRLATRESRAQVITEETIAAIDTIEASWQRLMAARQSVILNTRAFQAEQRQFEVGASTSTDVLDAAARLADAQFNEVRAVADYQIAQVDLAQATGTLLGQARVRWEPAVAPAPGEPSPPETLGAAAEPATGERR